MRADPELEKLCKFAQKLGLECKTLFTDGGAIGEAEDSTVSSLYFVRSEYIVEGGMIDSRIGVVDPAELRRGLWGFPDDPGTLEMLATYVLYKFIKTKTIPGVDVDYSPGDEAIDVYLPHRIWLRFSVKINKYGDFEVVVVVPAPDVHHLASLLRCS